MDSVLSPPCIIDPALAIFLSLSISFSSLLFTSLSQFNFRFPGHAPSRPFITHCLSQVVFPHNAPSIRSLPSLVFPAESPVYLLLLLLLLFPPCSPLANRVVKDAKEKKEKLAQHFGPVLKRVLITFPKKSVMCCPRFYTHTLTHTHTHTHTRTHIGALLQYRFSLHVVALWTLVYCKRTASPLLSVCELGKIATEKNLE